MLFIHLKLRALASPPEGMNVRLSFWPMESATQTALDVSLTCSAAKKNSRLGLYCPQGFRVRFP